MPVEAIVGMGTAIIPAVDSTLKFVLLITAPFNVLKWVLISALTGLMYKPLSPILHGRKRAKTEAEETRRIGASLARQLRANDVVLLLGDMGAGKSELTRGIARGLGVTGYVTSPTFTILQVHEEGRLPLYHFDWYRLESAEELYELAMDEYLQNGGVAVVEWPCRAPEAVPACRLEVEITPLGDTDRALRFTPVGGFRELDWEGWIS